MKHILKLLIFCCIFVTIDLKAQTPTSVPYSFGFEGGFGNWVNDDNLWEIGSGTDGQAFNSLSSASEGSNYAYIQTDKISNKKASISQHFDFTGISMPMMSFRLYFYANNQTQQQRPILKISIIKPTEYDQTDELIIKEDDNIQDNWRTINCCLSKKCANSSDVKIIISVESNSAESFSVAIDDVKISGMSISISDKKDVSCYGYSDGLVTIAVNGGGPNYYYSGQDGVDGSWSNLENSNIHTFSNLSQGELKISVKDQISGCKVDYSQNILQPEKISFQIVNVQDIRCYNDNNGSFEVKVDDNLSNSPFEFSKNNGTDFSSSNVFSNLSANKYNVVVKNSANCISQPQQVEIGKNAELEINSVNVKNITTCYGDDSGEINIQATGYNSPISTDIHYGTPESSFANSHNLYTRLSAGTYNVAIKDSKGCIVQWTNPIEITQPEQLVYETSDKEDVTGCFGNFNGTITPHAHGGTPPYRFSLDGNEYKQVTFFEKLGAKTYNMSVIDSQNCKDDGDVVSIEQPEKLIINDNGVEIVDVSTCYGDHNGSITIFASGGTAPLSYSIDEKNATYQNSNLFDNLSKGIYYPSVKDANGCSFSKTEPIKLTEPTQLEMLPPAKSDEGNKCFGDKNGIITMQATGGTPPYTFTVDNFVTTKVINRNDVQQMAIFSSLGAGIYNVKLKDSNGCISKNENVEITHPTKLNVDIVSVGNISCWGENDAKVVFKASGGTPSYSYGFSKTGENNFRWNADSCFSLYAGNYELAVKDINGCQVTYSTPIIIPEPAKLEVSNRSFPVSTCYGDSTGGLDIYVRGGTAPFSYSIDNGENFQSDYQFFDLPGGYYTILVVDNNGCSVKTSPILVSQPTQIEIFNPIFHDVIGCKGEAKGYISYTASGGTGNLRYSIDGGNTFSDINEFDNLLAGVYKPFVIDSKGCNQSFPEIEIFEPETFVLDEIVTGDVSCYGYGDGTVTISVSGGKKINSNSPYRFYLDFSQDPISYDGEIIGLEARKYDYKVVDEVGCTLLGDFTISQPNQITFIQKDTTNIELCYGDLTGTATIKAIGGVEPITYSAFGNNYNHDNSTGHFENMPASNYEFSARDANGCVAYEYASIIQPEKISYTTTIDSRIKCFGDNSFAFTVVAEGGTAPYKYSINDGKSFDYTSNHFENVKPGFYFVKAMDSNGCTQPYNYEIEVVEPASLELDYEKYDVICNSGNTGKIIASAKGGTQPYSYSLDSINWKPVTGVFSNLTDSTYVVKLKDANGCTAISDNIVLTRPDNIAGFKLNTYEGCSPLDIVITQDFKGIANYDITDGTKLYDRTGPAKHTFINTTTSPKTFTIKSSMMQVSGIGCTDTAVVNLIVNPQPISDVRVLTDSVVYPETTAYFANMSQNITSTVWDFGDGSSSTNINESSHEYQYCGNYNIILVQSDGRCYDTVSFPFIIQGRPVIAAMKTSSLEGCQPITVQFQNTSSNADSCVWNFGDGTTSKSEKTTHTFEAAGDYDVSLTAYGDCGNATTTTKTVHVFTKPSAGFIQNADTLYEGQSLRLDLNASNSDYYQWDFGDGKKSEEKNPTHLYEFGGTFTISLIVTTQNSCSDTSIVPNAITIIKNPIVVFPNAFTPNGDGINDVFKPIHGDIANYKIVILDKKGAIMYRGTDIDEGWDGTRNGKPCPNGVYVYKANIVLRDKSFYEQTGYIVLLKIDVKK
ncbi:MAG: PKD domain-containing protein [Bacteroidales bacterium]|nr:PKD domain-containing protein [Bacteroidales bacterium]